MSNNRIKNLILLIVTAFILVSTTIITLSYVISTGPTSDGGTDNGLAFFRYFTSDSNIFVALVSGIIMVCAFKNLLQNRDEIPYWLIILYLISTTGTTVTLMTTTFFLTPLYMSYGYGLFFLFSGKMFFLHLFAPLLAIGTLLFLLNDVEFNMKHVFMSMSTVVVYSMVYVPMVISKSWPDFYGFTFGGKLWAIPLSLIAMYGVTFGLAIGLSILHNLIVSRKKKA